MDDRSESSSTPTLTRLLLLLAVTAAIWYVDVVMGVHDWMRAVEHIFLLWVGAGVAMAPALPKLHMPHLPRRHRPGVRRRRVRRRRAEEESELEPHV